MLGGLLIAEFRPWSCTNRKRAMSATDFLPRRQLDLLFWSRSFNNQIGANPESYGLSYEQAADYNAKHNAYESAFVLATAARTNSRSNIIDKNEAQRVLRKTARQLAGIIRSNRAVTDSQRANLGMTIRRRGGWHARHPVPTAAPTIEIISEKHGRVKFRLGNSAEPSRRGRPRGTSGAVLLRFIGEHLPPSRDDWSYLGQTVKVTNTIALPSDVQPGTKIWLTAMWMSTRGDVGPAATPVCIRQPFDTVGEFGHPNLRLVA